MLLKNFYTVVSEDLAGENRFQASIKINKDHEIFVGHFPNNPILPGVALLEIIKQLLEKQLNQNLILQKASNIKFLALINPNEKKNLVFDFQITPDEEKFKVKTFTSFMDGTAVLKCNATFVPTKTAIVN